MDVGVGMADHAHAYVLGDLPALQVGDHDMPKTVKALTGHLILPGLGIIWVHPRVGQYANKGLAKAAAASGKSLRICRNAPVDPTHPRI